MDPQSKTSSLMPLKTIRHKIKSSRRCKTKVTRKLLKKKTSVEELFLRNLDKLDGDSISVPNEKLAKYGDPSMRSLSTNLSETFNLTSVTTADYDDLSCTSSLSSLSINGFDNGSEASENSILTAKTTRELVYLISDRVKKNKPPPRFLAPLELLSPSQLSWNKKIPKKRNRKNPTVNIVPCLTPLEVILAKADLRLRQQSKIDKKCKEVNEEKVKALEKSIEYKYTRAERMRLQMEREQLQANWLRIIQLSCYLSPLNIKYLNRKETLTTLQCLVSNVTKIQKAVRRWLHYKTWSSFDMVYLRAFGKIERKLALLVRLFKKRYAVKKLKVFLNEFKGHHQMNVIVHQFLTKVRKVQRVGRDFNACKYAKVHALSKIWDVIEYNYIRRRLEQRKAKQSENLVTANHLQKTMNKEDGKDFIEMKNQSKKWSKVNDKMEEMIKRLKTTGVIEKVDEHTTIENLRVPERLRDQLLYNIVHAMRKEHYSEQRHFVQRKLQQSSTFTEDHVKEYLLVSPDRVRKMFKELDRKHVVLKYKPFHFFSSLSKKVVLEKVMEAHEIQGTFRIKIAQFP